MHRSAANRFAPEHKSRRNEPIHPDCDGHFVTGNAVGASSGFDEIEIGGLCFVVVKSNSESKNHDRNRL